MHRRLINELKQILQKTTKDNYSNFNYDDYTITVVIDIQTNDCILKTPTLKFKFNDEYPFSPPKCYIKIKNIFINIFVLLKSGTIFNDDMFQVTGKKCLCCSTILCQDNWTPTLRITDIVQEVKYMINFKIRLYKRYLCRKIQEKYLVNLPIHTYL
jgi:ubiquitin-protein ligase